MLPADVIVTDVTVFPEITIVKIALDPLPLVCVDNSANDGLSDASVTLVVMLGEGPF